MVLRIKPRTLCVLGRCSTTEQMPKPAPTGIFIGDKLSFSFLFPEWKFCQSHGGGLSCRLAATSGTTWMPWILRCWPCSTCGTALLSGSFRLSRGCMCSRFIYLLCLSVLSTCMCTVCVCLGPGAVIGGRWIPPPPPPPPSHGWLYVVARRWPESSMAGALNHWGGLISCPCPKNF